MAGGGTETRLPCPQKRGVARHPDRFEEKGLDSSLFLGRQRRGGVPDGLEHAGLLARTGAGGRIRTRRQAK